MAKAKRVAEDEMDEKTEQEFQAMISEVSESVSGRVLAMLTEDVRTNRANGNWADPVVADAWALGATDGLIFALATRMAVLIGKRTATCPLSDAALDRIFIRLHAGLREAFFA